ncbi:MAG: peptidoglycan DD-metalloendopeptidase family protein [Gammaproteobacteria bacterium]|nr:peptidoglycan DD-metalloendopeptidase family protein [Gammaproteobacteria bacterium]MDE2347132.1 peptidoglycan DD-metalloendopeptidase family protein [Gammaproteobacteria bacterium]
MNVIFVGRQSGRVKQFDLRHPVVVAVALAVVLVVVGGAFSVGMSLGSRQGNDGVNRMGQLGRWSTAILQQQAQIEQVRRTFQEKVNALAMQVGQMDASVIRLDALGRRLTHMANIDDGEFNFGRPPPQGGEGDSPGQPAEIPSLSAMVDRIQGELASREQQLGVLENLIMTRELNKQVYPAGSPVKTGWISSYFGDRSDPFTGFTEFHKGLDIAAPEGTHVDAVGAGLVTWAGPRSGYGNMVEINHGNGLATRYCHNEKLLVRVGDLVHKGEEIALLGSTGRSTGPHLHFEVLKNGAAVNPLPYVGAMR